MTQPQFYDLLLELRKGEKLDRYHKAIIHRCADNLDDFSNLFFGDISNLPPNPIHRMAHENHRLGKRGISQVIAAPRGSGKSVSWALIEPLHDCCYWSEHYVVIVSSTHDQSVQKLKDIRHQLLENSFLISVYGTFFSKRVVSAGEFVVTNYSHRMLFEAAGSGKEVRGKRFGAHRPTKIIFDDYESDEEVESEACRDKAKRLFNESFKKLGSPTTNIKVIGTVLHREALLNDLIKNPAYDSHFYKSIVKFSPRQDLWDSWKKIYTDLDNPDRLKQSEAYYEKNKKDMLKGTEVLWPQKESYLFLQKEIISDGWRAFSKERQNMPMADDEKIFDLERMHYFTDHKDHVIIQKSGVKIDLKGRRWVGAIDPATGQKKPNMRQRGDFTCILIGFMDDIGRLFIYDCYIKRVPPSVFISQILQYNELYRFSKFGVETNLYRELLMANIREAVQKFNRERRIPVKMNLLEIYQTEKKEKRIYRIEPKVDNGWILFNKSLPSEFFGQMADFPKGDHDDGPDVLEMLEGMVNNAYRARALNL